MKRTILTITLLILAGLGAANATQTVRELWDGVGKSDNTPSGTMTGFGNGTTSIGFAPGSVWLDPYSASNALIQVDVNFDVGAAVGLPTAFYSQGALWSDTFWGTGNANAAIPNNSSSNWIARALATNAWINCNSNGVYYFSAILLQGSDSAGGIAFSSGTNATDHYVGAGITWVTYPLTNGQDAGNSDYVCAGVLNDPSDTNSTLPEAQGLYRINAYNVPGANTISGATVLVGRIVTSAGGNCEVDVKDYGASSNLDTSVGTVVWDATYNFNETNVLKYLVVFMNNETVNYPFFEEGGMRVGTTWGEVVGIESAISVSPTNVVPTGASVTFTAVQANLGPVGYQWTTNGVPIPNATNSTYTIASPVTADSGSYDLIVSNAFGLSTNNPPIQLTVQPPAPPSLTVQPQLPATRFAGGVISLTPTVFGSPQFTYQWFHNGSPVPAPAGTNLSLSFSPVQLTDAGAYYLHVTNAYGATNSLTNTLTVIAPTGFDAIVVADKPISYWPLGETNGTVLHDYFAGIDGAAPDTTNYQGYNSLANSFGVPGPAYAGFAPGNTAIGTINGNPYSRLNVPTPATYSSNMTIVIWANWGTNFPGGDAGVLTYRDLSSGGGYGNIYGIQTADNAGQVGWSWNSVNDFNGQATGLVAPSNQWNFLALEIDPTNATMYVGNSTGPLLSVLATNTDNATFTNIVGLLSNYSPQAFASYAVPGGNIDIGNVNYPFASSSGSLQMTAAFKGAAIFNSSLTFDQVLQLYAAGVGLKIQATPNGPGSELLNWIQDGVLQQATSAQGPYTDVLGATPPYAVPTTSGSKFYRVKL